MNNDDAPGEAPHDGKVRQVELLISRLLRIGVMVSLLVIVVGTVISFTRHSDYFSDKSALDRLTHPGAAAPRTLNDVWQGLRSGRGQSLVMIGLLLLIATPVVRVAVSVIGFVYERDRMYIAITLIVLTLLMVSFVVGTTG